MVFGEIISSLGAAIGALEKIYKAATIGLDLNDKAHYHRIQRALRDLYFFQDGTITLLKRLANNEPIASIDFQKASTRYFAFSDDVYRSLQYVAEHSSYNNMGLSIADVNDIRRLLDFKMGVRAEIDEFIFEVEGPYANSDDEMRTLISRRARRILDLIEELNLVIERVDTSLRGHTAK